MKYKTGNMYNFDDFNKYNNMDKIERSYKDNHTDTQNFIGNTKLVYNPITKKMDSISKRQFDDMRKEKTNESFKFTENTFDIILKNKGVEEIKNILKDLTLKDEQIIDNMSEDELRNEWSDMIQEKED